MGNPLNDNDWMGSSDSPLTGFSWKKGSQRETSGIVIWSDVFLHTSVVGEKLAIILTDTQGLFDDLVRTRLLFHCYSGIMSVLIADSSG